MEKGSWASPFSMCAVLPVLLLAMAAVPSSAQNLCASSTGTACVLTWQNDNLRTGQNLNETSITYQTIATDGFGQRCSVALDGQVYAQPLVVTNVTIGNYTGPVVYVVTENDSVYAIQGTPPASGTLCNILLGPVSLLQNNFSGQPVMSAASCLNIGAGGCGTIAPKVGILGTPVINIDSGGATGTLYVVAEMQSGTSPSFTFYHFLHALEITTLAEGITKEKFNAPVQLCPNGCGAYTSASLFSHDHIQRPGLLYVPASQTSLGFDYLYVAFSMMDGTKWPWPDGFIVGYRASDLLNGTVYSYATSQGNGTNRTSFGGGIWQGGAGPAFGVGDASGDNFIYFNTANGIFDLSNTAPPNTDSGDSFIKLSPNLTVPTTGTPYFTPADQFFRDDSSCNQDPKKHGNDIDFGSGGPMLIPDNELAGQNLGHLAVSGDKEGGVWFIDRTNPGGYNSSICGNTCNCMQSGGNNIQTYWVNGGWNNGPLIHNSLAYWENDYTSHPAENYIYSAPLGGQLTQYQLCSQSTDTQPICSRTVPKAAVDTNGNAISFPWGLTPTISASSPETASDAIVWALSVEDPNEANPESTVPGTLFAFDALTMQQLYASSGTGSPCPTKDVINPATKNSLPTVANGYVYVGTESSNTPQQNAGYGTFYIFGPGRTC